MLISLKPVKTEKYIKSVMVYTAFSNGHSLLFAKFFYYLHTQVGNINVYIQDSLYRLKPLGGNLLKELVFYFSPTEDV